MKQLTEDIILDEMLFVVESLKAGEIEKEAAQEKMNELSRLLLKALTTKK